MRKPPLQVYAIIRFDGFKSEATIKDRISVTKIVSSLDVAESEVARLNKLNGSKGATYFWQATRVRLEDHDADAT